jgi:tetratricopeptide (TPR) repeat protein
MRMIWRGDRLATAGGSAGLRRPTAVFEPTGRKAAARYSDADGRATTLTFAGDTLRLESASGAGIAVRDRIGPIEPPPLSLSRAVLPVFVRDGAEAGMERYRRIRDTGARYDVGEEALNDLGYELLHLGALDAAIAVFRENVALYPGSWNVHDSLGEAYLAAGRIDEGRASYAESLRLNPENEHAREIVEGAPE